MSRREHEVGVLSPIYAQEWSESQTRISELVDTILARIQTPYLLSASMQTTAPGLTPEDIQPFTDQANQDWWDQLQQRHAQENQSLEQSDLISRARFHGIPNAQDIPPEILGQMLEEKRLAMQLEVPEGESVSLRELASIVSGPLRKTGRDDENLSFAEAQQAAGGLLTGGASALHHLITNIPVLGNQIAKTAWSQAARDHLSYINEGFLSAQRPEDVTAWNVAKGTGALAAYVLPSSVALKIVSRLGRATAGVKTVGVTRAGKLHQSLSAPTRMGPLYRSAAFRGFAKGAAATWLMEGGGPEKFMPQQEAVKAALQGDRGAILEVLGSDAGLVMIGGALDMAFELVIPALMGRVQQSFPSRTTGRGTVPPGRQVGGGGPTAPTTRRLEEGFEEADWSFVEPEGGGPPPSGPAPAGGLPPGPPLLGPGPTPAVPTTGAQRALGSPLVNEMQGALHMAREQRNLAQRLANVDELTGSGNRRAMELARPGIDADPNLAWVVMDARQFKAINDNLGHEVGDQVIATFGDRIRETAAVNQIPVRDFRFGGDEFSMAVPAVHASQIASTIENVTRQSFTHPTTGAELTTWLDAATGSTFAEADANLIATKGAGRSSEQYTPAQAQAEAEVLSTHAQLMESPAITDMVEDLALDVTHVAEAAIASRPGAIHLLRNVGEAGEAMRRMVTARARPSINEWVEVAGIGLEGTRPGMMIAEEGEGWFSLWYRDSPDQQPQRLGTQHEPSQRNFMVYEDALRAAQAYGFQPRARALPTQTRIIERMRSDGSTVHDLLISDGLPISNRRAQQYQDTGLFEGMTASYNGRTVTVADVPVNGGAIVRTSDGTELMVDARDVMPGSWGGDPWELFIPERGLVNLYNEFSQYSGDQLGRMRDYSHPDPDATTSQMRRADARLASDLDDPAGNLFGPYGPVATDNLPVWLDEFLDMHQIETPALRRAFESYVEQARVNEMRAIHVADRELRLMTEAELHQELTRQQAQNPVPDGWDGIPAEPRRSRRRAPIPYRGLVVPRLANVAEEKGFDWIPHTPRQDRYTLETRVELSEYGTGNSQYVVGGNWSDTRSAVGEYGHQGGGGTIRASFNRDTGLLYVNGVYGDRGARAMGPRMIRELGRRLVEDIQATTGAIVQRIQGDRVSGARREVERQSGYQSQHTADNYMDIDAQQLLGSVTQQGGILKDKLSDLQIPAESEAAAYEFLRAFNRELPDITPITDVPIEVAQGLGDAIDSPGSTVEPVFRDTDSYVRGLANEVDRIERDAPRIEAEMEELAREIEFDMDPADADEFFRNEPDFYAPPEAPFGPGERDVFGAPIGRDPDLPGGGGYDYYSGGAIPPGGRGGPPMVPPRGGIPTAASPPPSPAGPRPVTVGARWQRVQQADPVAIHQLMEEFDGLWTRFMVPFRHLMIRTQNKLQKLGVTEARPYDDYEAVTRNLTIAHNEAGPWHSEFSDIISGFGSRHKRDGTVVRIEEIPNWNDKLRAMTEAGYSAREMEAQAQLRPFFDRLRGEANQNGMNIAYMFDYIPHLRLRQGMPGVVDPYDAAARAVPGSEFFAEYARGQGMQARQVDIGVLGSTWIRAWKFRQHVGPVWDRMKASWNDPRIDPRMRDVMTSWMDIVRFGRDPRGDVVIKGVRQSLRTLGLPVTDGEVSGMFNTLLTASYRGFLGWRPDVVFRDSIQPLFTAARIGMEPIMTAYAGYIKSAASRKAMIDRALAGGWLERGMVRVANAEAFSQPLMTPEGSNILPPHLAGRREALARVGDVIHDALPPVAREGIQGTKADPMYAYMKLGELNRIVSGEGGYQAARKVIDSFHRGEITYGQLLQSQPVRIWPKPVQEHFKRMIDAGQPEQAANVIANETANFQFRYGARENPIGTRGTVGRIGMQLGTFSQQYIAYMTEALSSGTVGDKLAFAARYGAVTAALATAGMATGWKFGKWMWHESSTFVGGPAVGFMGTAVKAAAGVSASLQGREPSFTESASMYEMTPERLIPGVLGSFNPVAGGIRTAQNYGQNIGGTAPLEDFVRLTLTGESGVGPRWRQLRNEYEVPALFRDSTWQPEWGPGGFRPSLWVPAPPGAGAQQ